MSSFFFRPPDGPSIYLLSLKDRRGCKFDAPVLYVLIVQLISTLDRTAVGPWRVPVMLTMIPSALDSSHYTVCSAHYSPWSLQASNETL